MKVKIEISGIPKTERIHEIRGAIDKLLEKEFDSYKFIWELNKGLEK